MSFLFQANYERLIYTLPQDCPDIVSSSLHLYTASRGTAVVRGSIHFRNGLELRVNEVVDFITQSPHADRRLPGTGRGVLPNGITGEVQTLKGGFDQSNDWLRFSLP